jgi:MIF4G like
VADVLDNFVSDHVKSAERLLTVPMLVAANDIIVESVFSELCSIPMPAFPSVYYGTVFVDLCKVKDLRLAMKLLTAVQKMFHDAGSLAPEVFDRLTVLYSKH